MREDSPGPSVSAYEGAASSILTPSLLEIQNLRKAKMVQERKAAHSKLQKQRLVKEAEMQARQLQREERAEASYF